MLNTKIKTFIYIYITYYYYYFINYITYKFLFFFFFNDTATTEIYTVSDTLSLHDALPISVRPADRQVPGGAAQPRDAGGRGRGRRRRRRRRGRDDRARRAGERAGPPRCRGRQGAGRRSGLERRSDCASGSWRDGFHLRAFAASRDAAAMGLARGVRQRDAVGRAARQAGRRAGRRGALAFLDARHLTTGLRGGDGLQFSFRPGRPPARSKGIAAGGARLPAPGDRGRHVRARQRAGAVLDCQSLCPQGRRQGLDRHDVAKRIRRPRALASRTLCRHRGNAGASRADPRLFDSRSAERPRDPALRPGGDKAVDRAAHRLGRAVLLHRPVGAQFRLGRVRRLDAGDEDGWRLAGQRSQDLDLERP